MREFKFTPGEEVMAGLAGRSWQVHVESAADVENVSCPRYWCTWLAETGETQGRWFDETELTSTAV